MEAIFLNFIRLGKNTLSKENDPNYYIYREFILEILQAAFFQLQRYQFKIMDAPLSEENKKSMQLIMTLNSELSQIIHNYNKACTLEEQLKYEKIIDSIRARIPYI